MTSPVKLNFSVYQGGTFKQLLRWESSTKVYIPIVDITKSAPVQITAPGHNIPAGWRVKITNVAGMKEINSEDTYYQATVLTDNAITINEINSYNYSTYTSGGLLEYNSPVDINALTAEFTIMESLNATSAAYVGTTVNGGVVFDTDNNQIILNIPPEITATFDFLKALHEVKFTNGVTGEVIPFATGLIYVERGVAV